MYSLAIEKRSESSLDIPLKIVLPPLTKVNSKASESKPGPKATPQKLRKGASDAENPAKPAASTRLSKKAESAATSSVKKAGLKTKAEEHRTKRARSSGASNTLDQVQHVHRALTFVKQAWKDVNAMFVSFTDEVIPLVIGPALACPGSRLELVHTALLVRRFFIAFIIVPRTLGTPHWDCSCFSAPSGPTRRTLFSTGW